MKIRVRQRKPGQSRQRQLGKEKKLQSIKQPHKWDVGVMRDELGNTNSGKITEVLECQAMELDLSSEVMVGGGVIEI